MSSLPSSPSLSAIQSWDPTAYERVYLGWCLANIREPFMPEVLACVDESWFSSANTANLYTAAVQVVLECTRSSGLKASPLRVIALAETRSGEGSGWAQREVDACFAAEQGTLIGLDYLRQVCIEPWRVVRGKPIVQRCLAQAVDLLDSRGPTEDLPHRVDGLLRDASSTWNDCIHAIDRTTGITPDAFIAEALTPLDDTKPLSLPSGLKAVDRPLGGGIALHDNPVCGRLIVVAARPRIGKTALLANVCHGIAAAGGHLNWYSLEVSARQVFSRLAAVQDWALHSGSGVETISPTQFSSRAFTEAQRARLDSYRHTLARGITIRDDLLGLEQICSHIRLTKRRNDAMVMAAIDHLGLIGLPKADTQAISIGMATRALKLLAVELRIDIVLLCQLNRAMELRSDARPMLSDLRDSGRIEEDADVVLGLYRQPEGETPEHLQVIAMKNRHGAVGCSEAFFRLRHGVIYDRVTL